MCIFHYNKYLIEYLFCRMNVRCKRCKKSEKRLCVCREFLRESLDEEDKDAIQIEVIGEIKLIGEFDQHWKVVEADMIREREHGVDEKHDDFEHELLEKFWQSHFVLPLEEIQNDDEQLAERLEGLAEDFDVFLDFVLRIEFKMSIRHRQFLLNVVRLRAKQQRESPVQFEVQSLCFRLHFSWSPATELNRLELRLLREHVGNVRHQLLFNRIDPRVRELRKPAGHLSIILDNVFVLVFRIHCVH